MHKTDRQNANRGFSGVEALLVVLVLAVLATVGWYVWFVHKNAKTYTDTTQTTKTPAPASAKQTAQPKPNEVNADTSTWQRVNSVGGAFSVQIPGGWQMMNFAGNTLGGDQIGPAKTTRAVITTDTSPDAGDQRRFSIALNATALPAPQWQASSQDGTQTTQDFAIGSLPGKRYSIRWTQTANGVHQGDQIFQYVAALSGGRQLSVVYRQAVGDPDNQALVEQVVRTIQVR